MATFKNIKELEEKVGDLVFYNLNGKMVVRRKSGFSKEGFANNPNYKKVKENSSEFGHCSKSGKALRLALEPFLGDYEDRYLYQKFAKVMTQIKDLDTQSERGKRRIENGLKHQDALKLLTGFQFGKYEKASDMVASGDAIFTKTVSFLSKSPADKAQLITLNPDLVNLSIQTKEQTLPIVKNAPVEFDFQFDGAALLLYFLILKKNEDVLYAGFIQ